MKLFGARHDPEFSILADLWRSGIGAVRILPRTIQQGRKPIEQDEIQQERRHDVIDLEPRAKKGRKQRPSGTRDSGEENHHGPKQGGGEPSLGPEEGSRRGARIKLPFSPDIPEPSPK